MAANADKQLDTLYKTVGELKEIGYPKFKEQLRKQSFAYEWDDHILDLTLPIPAAPSQVALRNRRNAYMVIVNKCDGHTVEHLLESCEQGDAQGAFRIVHNYFHRDSQAGKTVAFKDFYGATMANTDTDIVSWVARCVVWLRFKSQLEGKLMGTRSSLFYSTDVYPNSSPSRLFSTKLTC